MCTSEECTRRTTQITYDKDKEEEKSHGTALKVIKCR